MTIHHTEDVAPLPPMLVIFQEDENLQTAWEDFKVRERQETEPYTVMFKNHIPQGVYMEVDPKQYHYVEDTILLIAADHFFKASDYAKHHGVNAHEWFFLEHPEYLGLQTYTQLP